MHRLSPFFEVLLIIASTIIGAKASASKRSSCACGYIDDQNHIWRESIVSDFTQDAGAIAALGSDWIIASDFEAQSGTATADIQYTEANVMQFNDALGIRASAVSIVIFFVVSLWGSYLCGYRLLILRRLLVHER